MREKAQVREGDKPLYGRWRSTWAQMILEQDTGCGLRTLRWRASRRMEPLAGATGGQGHSIVPAEVEVPAEGGRAGPGRV